MTLACIKKQQRSIVWDLNEDIVPLSRSLKYSFIDLEAGHRISQRPLTRPQRLREMALLMKGSNTKTVPPISVLEPLSSQQTLDITKPREKPKYLGSVSTVKLKQLLEVVSKAKRNAGIMWSLCRDQQLWTSEQEADLKQSWKEYDNLLSQLWVDFACHLPDSEDRKPVFSASITYDFKSVQAQHLDVRFKFATVWTAGIKPGHPLRLEEKSLNMVNRNFNDWYHYSYLVHLGLQRMSTKPRLSPFAAKFQSGRRQHCNAPHFPK